MGQLNSRSRVEPDPTQESTRSPASPGPLLCQRVRVTQGPSTSTRDLLLFRDSLVIAKTRRGTILHTKLCLPLHQLWVLSRGAWAPGDAAQEEEDKATRSLILSWPYGFCVITFQPSEGVDGACVTQLSSFNLLLQDLRGRKAETQLTTRSLQSFIKDQAVAGPP
ncbi:uncharacterized protein LOC128849710 [Cuculus canorus]|uniref:uncharacterized protein LOC128849478 n=1 Tax=Cuculus canorus TaxID=55661 RepID=UPI0023AA7154|nr:uncharacterized protein LOC128849478 [Cuculus canorus]XP_053907509.1 uncharacterized protein LOC128849479 [Cuculus canorus]XP_053908174.1 uncharacterized protein LOC128849709 [Cuculus canorus]XP_053908175.1 uncharacterized protein LOC128849710 [Cuculus canorus]